MMRNGILLTTLALLAFAAPVLAVPDYQGIADDLRSEDAMRISNAARMLAMMPHEERTKAAPIVAPATIELFKHPHVGIRASGLRLITMFRDGSVDVWTPVVALTLDPNPGIRAVALDTLGSLCGDSEEGQKKLLPHLLIGLADAGWRAREEAGKQAAKFSISLVTLVPALTVALEAEDKVLARKDPKQVASTRCALISALAKAGKDAAPAEKALTTALEDKDAGVRAGAALALGRIGEAAKGAEKPLAEALGDDEPEVRAAAARALSGIGAENARTAKSLGKLLRDKSDDAALAAAETLRELPALAANEVTALVKALRHKSDTVRAAAATALGAVGPAASRAAGALEKMAKRDESAEAKSAAKQALERIRAE